MSTLTVILTVLASALFLAALIAIYLTNVTARSTPIPRWVLALGGASLVVGAAAVLTSF